MSIVKKASMVAAIVMSIVGRSTAPATAALIDFSFTTESGGTGTFTLDTDTALDPSPVFFGGVDEGIGYTGAISNFSVSTPNINLSSVTGDYAVLPSSSFGEAFDIPDTTGVYSVVVFPAGCAVTLGITCSVEIPVSYSGNLELPVLSDSPLSYSLAFDIATFDPQTGDLLTSDLITEYQVVPEPGSILGTIAVGTGGAGLLLKRQMNRKKAAIRL